MGGGDREREEAKRERESRAQLSTFHIPSWASVLILNSTNMAAQNVATADGTMHAKLERAMAVSQGHFEELACAESIK